MFALQSMRTPESAAEEGIMISKTHVINLPGPWVLALSTMAIAFTTQSSHPQTNSLLGDTRDQQTRAGNVQDEVRVAGDYLVGRGVPMDPAQAAYWYRKAADQGDPEAQDELGYFYLAGIGVPRDESSAIKWFTRAAGSGSQRAKLNLAVIYMKGIGVHRNISLGLDTLNDLAKKGYAVAESYLGIAYYCGYGVQMNHAVAEKWFVKGAKAGDPVGEFAMGTLYSLDGSHEHDLTKAAEYLGRAAKSGYVPAMHALGLLLVNHPDLASQQPAGEAAQLLETAAESGNWRSTALLGILSRDGRGIAQDTDAAYRWFTIAAKQGGDGAQKYLLADLTACRRKLGADEEKADVHAAEAWLQQHPHSDLFLLARSQQTGQFPILEIYDIAQAGLN
jgi:hypothetical protein